MNELEKQDKRDAENKKKDEQLWSYLKWGMAAVVLIWLGVTFGFLLAFGGVNSANELGDAFGSVNALFSAFAFAFLIYTAMMQKRELEYQREELRDTRLEIAKSAKAHENIAVLTSEGLEIQKRTRRGQIKPKIEFKIVESNYLVSLRSGQLESHMISFQSIENSLIVKSIEIKNPSGLVLFTSISRLIDKQYDAFESENIQFKRLNQPYLTFDILKSAVIEFTVADIDNNIYRFNVKNLLNVDRLTVSDLELISSEEI